MSSRAGSTAAVLGLALAVLTLVPSSRPFVAADAQGCDAVCVSSSPIAQSSAWHGYVEGNDATTLRAVSVTATGNVTNPEALVTGSGQTTLTAAVGGAPPVVVLDYRKEVGGLPFFGISSVSVPATATSVTMQAGYSELNQYLLSANPSVVPPVGASQASPIAGDANGNNGVGTDGSRKDSFTLTAASAGTTVGNASTAVQGGQRYEAIALTTAGTVVLSSAGTTVKFNNAGTQSYVGHFLSNDDTLNRIWYDGVYTAQTNDVPIGGVCSSATACAQAPVILDGAKRDRRPWSGDLSVEGRTLFDSLGFGPVGSDYIKSSIQAFGSAPQSNGSICGQISNWVSFPTSPATCSFYSPTYSMYYVLNLAEYYLYSGDTSFAESQYQVMKNQLAYNATSIDTSGDATNGLSTASGMDWDFYDGSKGGTSTGNGGAVSATNMLNYEGLVNGSWLAAQLAAADPANPNAAAWSSDATSWSNQAASLKNAINAVLFNTSLGVYQLSTSDIVSVSIFSPTGSPAHPATAVPQDANAQAIAFGVAPPSKQAGILQYLKNNLWGTYGPQPYSSDAMYSTVISPFVTGYELDARFAVGDTASALDLTKLMWAQMVTASGPFYTGTLWEKLGQNGQITDSNASLAHGWATAPVSAFSSYLLGVQPTSPGYATWTIAPQLGNLLWAQGDVPSPSGPLASAWELASDGSSFRLTTGAPDTTSGSVAVPVPYGDRDIAMDGHWVWQNGAPVNGAVASALGKAVQFSGISGTHTFAWTGPAQPSTQVAETPFVALLPLAALVVGGVASRRRRRVGATRATHARQTKA